MARVILHVDMDAFFAAIEQLRRPELRGQPVVVGGDGDPRKRGVVSTASYEARAYGIHSAMPLRTALKRCPHAIFLPVDFPAYRDFSSKLMRLLHDYSPLVEPMSLDEAFVDVSHRDEDPIHLAGEIKQRIRDELGLTASVGVGSNKLLAKIAANLQKPDALNVIWEHDVEERLRDLPATVLWGIGPKTAARLREVLQVETVGDLQRASAEQLQELLGAHHGAWLHRISRGIDDSPVVTEWEPKSMSRETTFQVDVRRRETLLRTIRALGEEAWEDVREDGCLVRTVTVKIRYHTFRTHTRAQTLPEATGDRHLLLRTAVVLLDRFTLDRPVRLVGVRFSNFVRSKVEVRSVEERDLNQQLDLARRDIQRIAREFDLDYREESYRSILLTKREIILGTYLVVPVLEKYGASPAERAGNAEEFVRSSDFAKRIAPGKLPGRVINRDNLKVERAVIPKIGDPGLRAEYASLYEKLGRHLQGPYLTLLSAPETDTERQQALENAVHEFLHVLLWDNDITFQKRPVAKGWEWDEGLATYLTAFLGLEDLDAPSRLGPLYERYLEWGRRWRELLRDKRTPEERKSAIMLQLNSE